MKLKFVVPIDIVLLSKAGEYWNNFRNMKLRLVVIGSAIR
jgi:hypothetical protein